MESYRKFLENAEAARPVSLRCEKHDSTYSQGGLRMMDEFGIASVGRLSRRIKRSAWFGTAVGRWEWLALLYCCRCGGWFPAEKPSDPVRALPPLHVGVARKPPATQLKADHVGRRAGAAANAVELADRSFD